MMTNSNPITQRILVLYAGCYDVQDEKTGKMNSGCSVSYYLLTDLSPIGNPDGSMGLRPAKCSVDSGFLNYQIKKAPAVYDAAFTYKVGSNGKPTLTIADLEYVGDIFIDLVEAPGDKEAGGKKAG